ncbi:MAG TPA: hypothetical protein VF712_06825 [Thermoleophilaceae bacterium]
MILALLAPAMAEGSPRRCRVGAAGCPPSVVVTRVPERCGDATFHARVRVYSSAPRRVVVYLDGVAVSVRRDRHAEIAVACAELAPGTHRLAVAVRDRQGRRGRWAGEFEVIR